MAPPDLLAQGRLTRLEGRRWTTALFAVFFICGITMASWLARLPAIRDRLDASTFQMGLLMVGLSTGSIVGLTASSHVIARYGARATMRTTAMVALAGLLAAGVGAELPSFWLIVLSLATFGFGFSMCDVAMNLSGAANEKVLGRTLMPLFHALFSFGTMAGAGLGALAERLGVAVVWHLGAVVLLSVGSLLAVVGWVRPESLAVDSAEPDEPDAGWKARLAVWRQPATVLIGLIVLGMAFAEGSAGDWLALAMVDERGTSRASGAIIYGVFVTAMTIGRVGGVFLLDRFGRVPVLRVSAVSAVIGLAMVIWVPSVPVAVIGTVLWGLGASLGFPVGMSAAADDPRTATARVSAVATIGYLAFLVGPPGLGLLGQHIGLLNALIVVMVLIAIAAVVAPAAREPQSQGKS